MSARQTTITLLDALRLRYIKPSAQRGMQGGVFIPECGVNGGVSAQRCDALYVGFTSTSGRLLVGHEIKASRSDWLHELAQPGKADFWADQCHEWWLVAAPGVCQDGELPHGWGLLEPSPAGRLRVVHRPVRHPERQPSWTVVRSIMARLDTLTAGEIAGVRQGAREQVRAQVEKEHQERQRRHDAEHDPVTARRVQILAELEDRLGVRVEDWRADTFVSRETFALALQIARSADELGQYGALERAAENLHGHATHLEQIARGIAGLRELGKAGAA